MIRHLPIALVLLVALVTRFADLGNMRMGLHPDEVMYGYEALSIRDTGTDHRQTGRPPLYLRGQSSHWDNRTSVLYPYILAGLFSIVPPTIFVERAPAAMASVLVVLLIYLVARQLLPNRRSIAVVAAALVTASPVAFFWGRLGHDLTFLPFFTLLVLWIILKSRSDRRWWFAAAATAGLALYTYQALKLVMPLTVLLGWWYVWPTARQQWRMMLGAALVGLAVAAPMVVTQVMHWSEVQGEFGRLNLLAHPQDWWRIPNQLWHFIGTDFLLSWKVVFPFLAPLGAFGFWWIWKHHRRAALLLALWFAIAMIPMLITRVHYEGVDMQWRSLGTLGILEICTAAALIGIVDWLRSIRLFRGLSKIYVGGLVAMFVVSIMALTWIRTGDGQPFCCVNYGGLDRVVARLQAPDLADRPVVIELTSYALPDYVLWLTQFPPADFQRGPVGWSTFIYPELGPGEHPTAFGRFRLCRVESCHVPGDGAIYVVPADRAVPGKVLMALDLIAPQWETSRPWPWVVIDSSTL